MTFKQYYKIERKVKVYVFIILLLIVIPSVFKFYNIIQESIFVQNTERFISEQITIDNEIVLSEDNIILEYDEEAPKITLNIDGKYLIENGMQQGSLMGKALKKIEEEWIQNNFQITKQRVKEIISSYSN